MSEPLEPLFVRRVRGPISSSPLLVDANRDGWPEIFAGGPVLQGLTWDGEPLPRWPKKAGRPFASSPAFGDIHGDGRGKIVVGCDDGRVYAFHVDGDPVEGWPVRTGGDVFSTPALADLDGDKALEVIVGSDDGALYLLKGNGNLASTTQLPGRPFISASPTLEDLDDDGKAEIAVGAWDHAMRVWSPSTGERPRQLATSNSVIWSSATAFAIGGLGHCLAWASDRVYVARSDGSMLGGWPRHTESWMVSSPAVVELTPRAGATILVGAERVYAWDLSGRLRPGWPVDVGAFAWSSPIAFDVDGDGRREVVVGSWDGAIHAFHPDGTHVSGFPLRTEGPIFSTPAAAPLPGGSGLLVAASWDGTIRGWRLPRARFEAGDWLQFRGTATRTGRHPATFDPVGADPQPTPRVTQIPALGGAHVEHWAGMQRVVVEGEHLSAARKLQLVYSISGERKRHPVPVVNSAGTFVALVQPLRIPHVIRYSVELEDDYARRQTWPARDSSRFLTRPRIVPLSGGNSLRKRPTADGNTSN